MILKNIRVLWANTKTEKVSFYLAERINHVDYKLIITDQQISLLAPFASPSFSITLEKIFFSKSQFKKVKPEVAEELINEYERLRQNIIYEINKSTKDRDNITQKMADIKRKYSPEVDIELDFSKTQNVQSIELLREDGKSIGVINFGERTVKIITDGDIVLVRRDNGKEPKTKRR